MKQRRKGASISIKRRHSCDSIYCTLLTQPHTSMSYYIRDRPSIWCTCWYYYPNEKIDRYKSSLWASNGSGSTITGQTIELMDIRNSLTEDIRTKCFRALKFVRILYLGINFYAILTSTSYLYSVSRRR